MLRKRNNKRIKLGNLFFIEMNGDHMLFPNRLFDRVLSNCGISYSTLPQTSREIFRVLQTGGQFFLNDWHLIDVPPHRTFSEILRIHRTDHPSRKLRRWREALATLESRRKPILGSEKRNIGVGEGRIRENKRANKNVQDSSIEYAGLLENEA